MYFSLTLFVSATLLFLVQPMIGKMILPQLGGTPAVWNTCMVFFQGVLLVGYGYTHLLTTTQPTRRQVLIQGCLLFLPFLVLPFSLGNWTPPTEDNPIFSLLGKLIIMVGLPFLMVSTTAPLLQKWFFHTGHPAAKDPYFLYGASNFGSMLGLGLYPTVLEPWLPVTPPADEATWQSQVHLWTFGYAIFVAMVVGCAVIVWQTLASKLTSADEPAAPPTPAPPAPAPVTTAPATAIAAAPKRRGARIETSVPVKPTLPTPSVEINKPYEQDNITLWRRLRWIGLAAAPSSLMLGVTTYMTTDIAAVSYFWIIPLMMYLFTFILVFARWPTVWTGTPHTIVMFVQPCLLLFLVLKMIGNLTAPHYDELLNFALHLGAFFSTTLMCHGELAKDRPTSKHLTEFYFWMSLGGVGGGLFNALFAPVVFQYGIWEYMVALSVACLMRSNLVDQPQTLIPGDSTAARPTPVGHVLDYTVPIVVGVVAYFLTYLGDSYAGRPVFFDRYFLLAAIGGGVIVTIGTYYSLYADRTKKIDTDLLHGMLFTRNHARLVLYFAAVLGYIAFFSADVQVNIGMLVKRSYFLAVLVVVVLALSLRPVRFGLSVGALFIAVTYYDRAHDPLLYEGRGFFGLLRVREESPGWTRLPSMSKEHETPFEWKVYRTLIHGGINHGRQIVRFKTADENENDNGETEAMNLVKRREPITYFHQRNGVAELFYKLAWPDAEPLINVTNMTGRSDVRLPASMVGLGFLDSPALAMLANTQSEPSFAVVGLGTGILACYAKPFQRVDFYEIDPLVKSLSIVPGYVPPWDDERAKMPKLPDPTFYFVHDAQERWANMNVILGDGRLKLKEMPHQNYYHVIVLDAFSSDAIPVHLLTKEAVKLYLDKLADNGVLLFNTTNRYVRIECVLSAIAKDLDLDCLYCPDFTSGSDHPDRFSADWLVLQRKSKFASDVKISKMLDEKDWPEDTELVMHGKLIEAKADFFRIKNRKGVEFKVQPKDKTTLKISGDGQTWADLGQLDGKLLAVTYHPPRPFQNGGRPIAERLEQDRKRQAWNGMVIRDGNGEPVFEKRWQEMEPLAGPVWTDGYSNMLNPRVMPWLMGWLEKKERRPAE